MLETEKARITLKRTLELKLQVADGTAALGERLLLDLDLAKAAGVKTTHEYCRVIRKHASLAVMEKAGFPEKTPIERTMTLNEMDSRFYQVRRDVSLPSVLRNEAAEIGSALRFILPKPISQRENEILQMGLPGRVCRFCWRTEAVRSGNKPLGFCHKHDISAWNYEYNDRLKRLKANVAKQTRLLEYVLEEKIRVAGRPGLPKVVIVTKDIRIILAKIGNQIYPRLDPMPLTPGNLELAAWADYVIKNYSETARYIIQLTEYPVALSSPLETMRALEDRELTEEEIIEVEYPIGAVPILRRCESWLRLAESARLRRKPGV